MVSFRVIVGTKYTAVAQFTSLKKKDSISMIERLTIFNVIPKNIPDIVITLRLIFYDFARNYWFLILNIFCQLMMLRIYVIEFLPNFVKSNTSLGKRKKIHSRIPLIRKIRTTMHNLSFSNVDVSWAHENQYSLSSQQIMETDGDTKLYFSLTVRSAVNLCFLYRNPVEKSFCNRDKIF